MINLFEIVYIHRRKLSVGMTFLIATFLITTTWYSSPDLLFEISATISSILGGSVDYSGGVNMNEQDVDFMNRVFSDRDYEVGYCGILEDDEITEFTMADTVEASESHIVFNVQNCPFNDYIDDEQRVIMHTHPGGSDWLSHMDKQTFFEGDFELSCVQYDNIAYAGSSDWDGINCFEKDGVESVDDEFPGVDVSVS